MCDVIPVWHTSFKHIGRYYNAKLCTGYTSSLSNSCICLSLYFICGTQGVVVIHDQFIPEKFM